MSKKQLNKPYLRNLLNSTASYTEIYLSMIIIMGIIFLSASVIGDLFTIVDGLIKGTGTMSITMFLPDAFDLIIGIEFVKMLAKHTPSSAVEVLLFAIARQIIHLNNGQMLEVLLGVLAIALLFAIRKYLSEAIHKSSDQVYIVNGGTTLEEINSKIGLNLDPSLGNTIAGVIYNFASSNFKKLVPGYELKMDEYSLQIHSMNEGLIEKVKLTIS